jgi:hypothetical protein
VFELKWTIEAENIYRELEERAKHSFLNRKKNNQTKSSKIEGLFKQVYKTVTPLQSNPRHPGLHTHEYHSIENPFNSKQKIFEAYVQNNTPAAYRIFWCYGPEQGQITISLDSAVGNY